MNLAQNIIVGILLLHFVACQEKALTTDVEKMQLKGEVQFIFEKTLTLFSLEDTLEYFKTSIHNTESEFWKFDDVGNIIEHGRIIPDENSVLNVYKYSNESSKKLTIITSKLDEIDSLVFYGNSFSQNDTLFSNLYFPDSTLYNSKKIVIDKYGREIYRHQTLPPMTPIIINYYSNGLIKNENYINSIYYDKVVKASQLATFKFNIFQLMFMSCCNVGNSVRCDAGRWSFPYFNRNFVGVLYSSDL